jgi:hypothetical protein
VSRPLLVVSTAQLLNTSVLALKYEYELICQEKSKLYKIIFKRIISLMHCSILQRILLKFYGTLVFSALLQFSDIPPPRIFSFFGLNMAEETFP